MNKNSCMPRYQYRQRQRGSLGTRPLYVWSVLLAAGLGLACCMSGCASLGGYSSASLYPGQLGTIYVEMFDNRTFRRDVEYSLTDALAKRIESQTPYRIVSQRDLADTVLKGQITSLTETVLTTERSTGLALEKEMHIVAVVNWENMRTGELLLDSETVEAAASYSEYMQQGVSYAANLAANKLAQRIVEQMEQDW